MRATTARGRDYRVQRRWSWTNTRSHQRGGTRYIDPTDKAGADADVSWSVRDEYVGSPVEAVLDAFVPTWVADVWPLRRPRFIGIDLSWQAWLAIPRNPQRSQDAGRTTDRLRRASSRSNAMWLT